MSPLRICIPSKVTSSKGVLIVHGHLEAPLGNVVEMVLLQLIILLRKRIQGVRFNDQAIGPAETSVLKRMVSICDSPARSGALRR